MIKKSYINPNLIKISTYSLMAIILTTVVTIMTSRVLDKTMKKTEAEYFDSYSAIVLNSATVVSVTLDSYKEELSIFNNSDFLQNATEQEIKKYLIECTPRLPKDYENLLYINLDGKAIFNDGHELQLYGRNYYYKDKYDTRQVIIGDGIMATEGTGKYLFTIAKPVFDSEGTIKGSLCATIPISIFEDLFANSYKTSEGKISIQDGSKKFIYNENPNMLLRLPMVNPEDYTEYEDIDYSQLYSSYLRITGSKLDGKQYDFMIKMIPDTNWVISVYAPMEIRNSLKRQQNFTKIMIIVVIVLLIFVLSLIEIHVLEVLQKRQMIATIYDPLTGLSTRQHFEAEATKWLKRFSASTFMIIDADIRGFKFINQKYGEKEADEILVFFSRILREEAEYYKGIIGRGNADHFILMIKVTSVEDALNEFKNQLPILNEKFRNSEYSFFPSFGISFQVGKKSESNTIQNLIGQALFAKNSNKNNLITNYAVYDLKLVEKVKEEIYYEENMEQALENGEFFVMYQPKVDLTNDEIVGAEALVRWNSPKLGFVGPDKFIPVFEKNGFITKLDFFVYEQVFKFQQECLNQNLPVVPISLNMSRNHSKPEVFMKEFITLFKKFDIPPKYIEIEILERSVMDNMDMCQMVQLLHDEGFTVAMDDFGSGESSLNMLSKIPVDVLKFDKEFLAGNNSTGKTLDENTRNFIETLVNLGKNLKKQTVFEGVETESQRDFLKSIKCDLVQGFFYFRPLFSGEFFNFIQKKKCN